MSTSTSVESEQGRYDTSALEIEQLARSDIAEDRFFNEFLAQLIGSTGADAGIIWLLSQQGILSSFCDQGLEQVQLGKSRLAHRVNVQLVLAAIQQGESKLHAPDGRQTGDPSIDRVLIIVPLRGNDASVGAVELIFPEESPVDDRLSQLQFVEEMCTHATSFLAWKNDARSAVNHLQFWNRFERLQWELHRSLDSSLIAATAVNDARQLLGCDRVSLATVQGAHTVIEAVSGQQQLAGRSNVVRCLAAISAEVVATGRPITCDGNLKEMPPQLESLLLDYMEQSGSRMIKVIPLKPPETETVVESSNEEPDRQSNAMGALIVEQFSDSWLTPLTASRADLAAKHIASALHNARVHEGVFLLRLRRLLGRFSGWLVTRKPVLSGLVVAVLAGMLLAASFVPATYRVQGSGKLMPVVQRELFAPWDGEVAIVFVRGGQYVEENQKLLELRNDDLAAQNLAVHNLLEARKREVSALEATLDEVVRSASRKQRIELSGKIDQKQIEIEGLRKRSNILRKQLERMTIRSPIAGTVATFQVERLLRNRPVQHGQVLLQIMDEEGPWQLELEIAEQRMGHLVDARANPDQPQRPVDFVLATRPQASYIGAVRQVATTTDLSQEKGAVVKVLIDVNRDELPNRRIGAEVLAKIDCGQRSLAYVLFGDVVEFVQKRFW